MKSPENSPKSIPKKPRQKKSPTERKINSLIKSGELLVNQTVGTLQTFNPKGMEAMKNSIADEGKESNAFIILDTDVGLKMAFGITKDAMNEKPVLIVSIGLNCDDGKALNILDGVEDELLALAPEDDRQELELKMDISKHDGVEQIILEVIFPGSNFEDIKRKSHAVKMIVAPSGMTDNPIGFGLIRGSKTSEPVVLRVFNTCMSKMEELLRLIDILQMSQLMNTAFKCHEQVQRALNDESTDAAN